MVWAALAYAIVGSVLTHLVGRPLIGLDFNQQRFEADFRFSLGADAREQRRRGALPRRARGARRPAPALRSGDRQLVEADAEAEAARRGSPSFYGQLAIIFPLVVVSPRYFAGQIPLGGIFQTASAFGQVQGSLSWFINAYTQFAVWKATVNRLIGFTAALSEVHEYAGKPAGERIADGERFVDRAAFARAAAGHTVARADLGAARAAPSTSSSPGLRAPASRRCSARWRASGPTGKAASGCRRAQGFCSCRRNLICRSVR